MIQNSFKSKNNKLYLVATPIGNLDEVSIRTKTILQTVDYIFCEDTRVSQKLLNKLAIKKSLIALHKHNENMKTEQVLNYLKQGHIALISDAGYPLISDPGKILVQSVIAAGYDVVPISGPSAFINALVASGLNTTTFTFIGFLSKKITVATTQLTTLKYRPETLIFYESCHQIKKTLALLFTIFGNRKICLAREITKIYEQFYRSNLETINNNIDNIETKGEYVIVLSGYEDQTMEFDHLSIIEHINLVIKNSKVTINQAIKEVAQLRGLSKAIVYNHYHQKDKN